MKDNEHKADEGRRNFLKLAAAAAPAAAATAVAGEAAADVAEPQGSGLRKTAHVEAYLASARF
ncbi:MAG: hypothetical protein HUJ27_13620 [Rhodobacteraceae bacterium]|nr:hypothetical protein [Paracoccaceae bacterium]